MYMIHTQYTLMWVQKTIIHREGGMWMAVHGSKSSDAVQI